MAKKLSLANKYRPQNWSEVVEQDVVKVILNNQIKNDDVKRVYLFCGSAGVGKTSMCRLLAKEINHGIGNPIELDCATHNSVDDVRDIIEDCKIRPLQR